MTINGNYVICGFSGVGKSTADAKSKHIFDFESSGFSHKWDAEHFSEKNEEFPVNYIDAIEEHMKGHSGAVYLLSCHEEVRRELRDRDIDYIIVMPTEPQKNEYIKRWLRRGSSIDFIMSMSERWREMIQSCRMDGAPVIFLNEDEHISDVLPMC